MSHVYKYHYRLLNHVTRLQKCLLNFRWWPTDWWVVDISSEPKELYERDHIKWYGNGFSWQEFNQCMFDVCCYKYDGWHIILINILNIILITNVCHISWTIIHTWLITWYIMYYNNYIHVFKHHIWIVAYTCIDKWWYMIIKIHAWIDTLSDCRPLTRNKNPWLPDRNWFVSYLVRALINGFDKYNAHSVWRRDVTLIRPRCRVWCI